MMTTIALRHATLTIATLMDAGTTTIKLFQNNVTLTPDMVVGDFTEADFSGYADAEVTSTGTAWDDENLNGVMSFTGVHFQGSTGAITNTIYGWYMIATVSGPTPDELVQAVLFDTPIPINGSMDAIDFAPTFKLGQPVD